MARMRWVQGDTAGQSIAVCLYCDTEVMVKPTQSVYCYCRSGGQVVVQDLSPSHLDTAA